MTFDTFMFASIVDGRPIKQLQAAVPGQRRVGRAVDALETRVGSQGWFAWNPYSTRPTEGGRRGRGPGGRELAQRYTVMVDGTVRREWRDVRREAEARMTEERLGPR